MKTIVLGIFLTFKTNFTMKKTTFIQILKIVGYLVTAILSGVGASSTGLLN